MKSITDIDAELDKQAIKDKLRCAFCNQCAVRAYDLVSQP